PADIPATDYILIQDRKPDGTTGGTFTAGSWQTRDLNTEVVDTGNHATLSSNQITLAAGTYRVRAIAPARAVNNHRARFQNVSDGTTAAMGSNAGNSNSSSSTGHSE